MQITDLDDIAPGTYTPGAKMTGDGTVWIYGNTGRCQITATGDGGVSGTAFELAATGGSGGRIPYTVEWADTGGGGSGTSLTAGTVLPGQVDSVRVPDCGGNNARVPTQINRFLITRPHRFNRW